MRNIIATTVLALFSVGLLGCATPYGPYGLSGGYKDQKLAANKYIVSFYGNGNTSGQKVWNYWIYRCAELTLEKGYDFFAISAVPKKISLGTPGSGSLVEFTMLDRNRLNRSVRPRVVPVYYYTETVTTYSSRAVITMYKSPAPKHVGLLLDARTIKQMLAPYVSSSGQQASPDKKNLLIRAMVEVAIRSEHLSPKDATRVKKALRERM